MSEFAELIQGELRRARSKHATPIHSRHEGYAVVLEEVRELEAEVFRQHPIRGDVLSELVQVGAMCQRMAEDLDLV